MWPAAWRSAGSGQAPALVSLIESSLTVSSPSSHICRGVIYATAALQVTHGAHQRFVRILTDRAQAIGLFNAPTNVVQPFPEHPRNGSAPQRSSPVHPPISIVGTAADSSWKEPVCGPHAHGFCSQASLLYCDPYRLLAVDAQS